MIASFYLPGRSVLHRLDPRVKAPLVLCLLVLFFLPLPLWNTAAYLGFLVLLLLFALGPKELGRPLAAVLPILVLVAVLTPPFHPAGRVYLKAGGLILLSAAGLLEAARLMVRFAGVTLLFYAYLRCTEPNRLILSWRWYGLPFPAALVIGTSLQFIPHLYGLYQAAQDAHRLRLAERAGGGRAGFLGGLRGRVPVLTSVLIQAVRAIPALAMALESRGLGRSEKRTEYLRLKPLRLLAREAAAGAAVMAALVAPAIVFSL